MEQFFSRTKKAIFMNFFLMKIMQVIDLKLYTHNSTYFIKTQEFFFKLK